MKTDVLPPLDDATGADPGASVVKCDRCSRIVPIAPGFRSVTVPHVSPVYYSYADVRNAAYPRAASIKWCVLGTPCDGNKKRTARDEYVPDGWMLAHQYTVLEEDAYWEGL